MARHPTIARSIALGLCLLALTCAPAESPKPPNVLWIVWDTVRADHLGLYGYERGTTPKLDAWARKARVFEDALSTAGYTLPSHASMFTGLLPSEHCTDNAHTRLGDEYTTVAELLQGAGYRTYLFSANPHVSAMGSLDQGFAQVEHPWSPQYQSRAMEIVREKLPAEDESSELPGQFRAFDSGEGGLSTWNIKAAGALAQEALLNWLEQGDDGQPFYAFINYMEAHRPYIPSRSYRERFMSPDEVAASYRVDRSWVPIWEYTFGLREYSEAELALTRATYDATLAELDDLLAELLDTLQAGGHLDDTVIILTSDHGEHLGEQHMLDHQYSVYQPLIRVPLIVHYPPRFDAGRDSRPVVNYDLFPTLLELAGIAPPVGLESRAVSLLRPDEARVRFAEEPAASTVPLELVREAHPEWDPSPWLRQLRALVQGEMKYIESSDGRRELFRLDRDPLEGTDLSSDDEATVRRMADTLETYYLSLKRCDPSATNPDLTPEQLELLRSLGYVQ